MSQYPNAAEGIKKIFLSQILAIIATILAIIPVIGIIGTILAVISLVIYILGLKKAGEDAAGYNDAVIPVVISIVLSVVSLIWSKTLGDVPFLGSFVEVILGIVTYIVDLLILNKVIKSTNGLLNNVGANDLAVKGDSIWKTYLTCTIIACVCQVIGLIPLINIISGIVAFVVVIVLLVAEIRYILFLNNSSKAL